MKKVDPVKHRAKREHILNAAAGLFATRGFDGTSTAEICKAADMSSGNLFHYFSSKREIFVALLTYDEGATEARFAEAVRDDDPWGALLGFLDHLVAPAAEPNVPNLVLEAMLQGYRDAELAQRLDTDAVNEQAWVATLLARAADAGHIDADLDRQDTAGWLMALVGSLYLRAATEPGFDVTAGHTGWRTIVTRYLRAG